MRRLVASNVMVREAWAAAPQGYEKRAAYGELRPGRILGGPMWDNQVTVGLILGDDGAWLRLLAEKNGGGCEEDRVWTDEDRQAEFTAIRIMCEGRPGAALNAVIEDYPELWKLIEPLHAEIHYLQQRFDEYITEE